MLGWLYGSNNIHINAKIQVFTQVADGCMATHALYAAMLLSCLVHILISWIYFTHYSYLVSVLVVYDPTLIVSLFISTPVVTRRLPLCVFLPL